MPTTECTTHNLQGTTRFGSVSRRNVVNMTFTLTRETLAPARPPVKGSFSLRLPRNQSILDNRPGEWARPLDAALRERALDGLPRIRSPLGQARLAIARV